MKASKILAVGGGWAGHRAAITQEMGIPIGTGRLRGTERRLEERGQGRGQSGRRPLAEDGGEGQGRLARNAGDFGGDVPGR